MTTSPSRRNPRFVEPDISVDKNTGIFYINDKEKESVLK